MWQHEQLSGQIGSLGTVACWWDKEAANNESTAGSVAVLHCIFIYHCGAVLGCFCIGILLLVSGYHLVSLVVEASVWRAEDPGIESRLRRDFSGVESY